MPLILTSSFLAIPNVNAILPITPSPASFVCLVVVFEALLFLCMRDWSWLLWRVITQYLQEGRQGKALKNEDEADGDGEDGDIEGSNRIATVPFWRRIFLLGAREPLARPES
jgi:hypothetical protein